MRIVQFDAELVAAVAQRDYGGVNVAHASGEIVLILVVQIVGAQGEGVVFRRPRTSQAYRVLRTLPDTKLPAG